MRSYANKLHAFMGRCFTPYRRLSSAQVELAGMRVLQRLHREPMWQSASPLVAAGAPDETKRSPLSFAGPIAAGLVLAVVGALVLRDSIGRRSADATVEAIEGSLYRVVGREAHALKIAEGIAFGDTVRSNGGRGGTFTLADGSRVEMRSQSELRLERADDGVRIQLNRGGIIVNAAQQRSGHLYVQTKDVTVSVVGTVFLVNAEAQGSRVAVIEGEVRIEQEGGRSQTLLPGHQVATNPLMEPRAVTEAVSWSRDAVAHLALLQRSSLGGAASGQKATDRFEETSIRPSSSTSAAPPGARGGGGGAGGPCPIPGLFSIQTDPGRFVVSNTTVHTLIAFAYGKDCGVSAATGLVTGGPDWIRSDRFDVQSLIPAGSFSDTPLVRDPKLQKMIQTLLKERFNLLLRHEMKEMSAYDLVVVESGRIKLSKDQIPWTWTTGPPQSSCERRGGPGLGAPASPISSLANALSGWFGRPVIDKTKLQGLFDICLDFELDTDGSRRSSPGVPIVLSSVLTNLQEQLGLKLEPTRTTVEVLVIERAERPSEN